MKTLTKKHNKLKPIQQGKLINVRLTKLANKVVNGIVAQVVNPKYLHDVENTYLKKPMWRKLVTISRYTEKGKKWVELRWEREIGDTCNFTGCTVESDACEIQFRPEDYKKIK